MIYKLEFFKLNYANDTFKGKQPIGHVLITERLYLTAINHCRQIARENGIKLPLQASCQMSEFVVKHGKLHPETISYETLF